MRRYYIDTCVLIWLIDRNKRIKTIAIEIEYCQDDFAVSMEVLKEFFNLLAFNKIKTNIDYDKLIKKISLLGIKR